MKNNIEFGKVVGPYSPAIIASGKNLIFISGQLASDLQADIKTQTNQIMKKIKEILAKAEVNMEDIVKTTIFLTDMNDFKAVNEEYAKYFSEIPPARATIQVAALPLKAKIEIEAIAIKN